MSIITSLSARRSYYKIDKSLPVPQDEVVDMVRLVTQLVPDAFNMRSQRVVVALGAKQDELWDTIYDTFGGKVSHEKIDGFKAGAGSILYFIDTDAVKAMQEQYPRYAENFPLWALQANGMLQLSIWSALREMGIGANIQHYNPVIDDAVRALFNVPASHQLIAQMPFGGILAEPEPKEPEDVDQRVHVFK